jgi:hypothetical protein
MPKQSQFVIADNSPIPLSPPQGLGKKNKIIIITISQNILLL